MWSKIQLNITALSVNSYDFTFARKLHGEVVPYGEAGDCYSTANCPQGKFSINLTGTGLRVAAYTGWIGVGNRPSLWLQRIQDNQVIFGNQVFCPISGLIPGDLWQVRRLLWYLRT